MLVENNPTLEIYIYIYQNMYLFSKICYAQFQMIIERMFSFKGRTKDTQVEGEKPTPFSLNSQRFYIPSLMLFTNTRKKGEEKKKAV